MIGSSYMLALLLLIIALIIAFIVYVTSRGSSSRTRGANRRSKMLGSGTGNTGPTGANGSDGGTGATGPGGLFDTQLQFQTVGTGTFVVPDGKQFMLIQLWGGGG